MAVLYCMIKVLVRFWAISWAKCRFHPHFRENAWKKGKIVTQLSPFHKKCASSFASADNFCSRVSLRHDFHPFSRIFTKMWVKTYIYLTKSPKNRTKNFDQTMQQNVVQSAGVNAQFHEFSPFSRICRKKVSIFSKNVITQYLTFWTSKIFNSTPIVY